MAKTKCEVYSRIVGYLRPITQWNDGKLAEYGDRKIFKTEESDKNSIKSPSEGI